MPDISDPFAGGGGSLFQVVQPGNHGNNNPSSVGSPSKPPVGDIQQLAVSSVGGETSTHKVHYSPGSISDQTRTLFDGKNIPGEVKKITQKNQGLLRYAKEICEECTANIEKNIKPTAAPEPKEIAKRLEILDQKKTQLEQEKTNLSNEIRTKGSQFLYNFINKDKQRGREEILKHCDRALELIKAEKESILSREFTPYIDETPQTLKNIKNEMSKNVTLQKTTEKTEERIAQKLFQHFVDKLDQYNKPQNKQEVLRQMFKYYCAFKYSENTILEKGDDWVFGEFKNAHDKNNLLALSSEEMKDIITEGLNLKQNLFKEY